MALQNLRDTLEDSLKDLYNAEKQLLRALPRLAKAATSPKLRSAFQNHVEVTEGQVTRLEEVFKRMDLPARGKHCAGMEGLIAEGKEVLEKKTESTPEAVDASLIMAAQKVEHYEISAYGSSRAFAEALGFRDVANLLQKTLDEESEANEELTTIAVGSVNAAAAKNGGEGSQADEDNETEEDEDDVS